MASPRTTVRYTMAGGNKRSFAAEADTEESSQTLAGAIAAVKVGTVKGASQSNPLVAADYALSSAVAQFQDAVFVFQNNATGDVQSFVVTEFNLTMKGIAPGNAIQVFGAGTNANVTELINQWIQAKADRAGYAIREAYVNVN